ncbi:MAG: DUF378 domain-containing protein [Firmicutes bacterium]|nr:DUF378 domain-containing protein [Bacillota bacterium]
MVWKKILNLIAFSILLLGGLNWLLVGIFNVNLVSMIFMGYRSIGSIIAYVLIGLSAIWLVISSIVSHGRISFVMEDKKRMN